MWSWRVACTFVVLLEYICCVQSQWNHFSKYEESSRFSSRTSNSDWGLQNREHSSKPSQFQPQLVSRSTLALILTPSPPISQKNHSASRVWRDVQQHNQFNTSQRTITLINYFEIEQSNKYGILTEDLKKRWIANAEVFKEIWQTLDYQFLNPSGVLVSIPDNNITITILHFYMKLNVFFFGNDNPIVDNIHNPIVASTSKSDSGTTAFFPSIKVHQGDNLNYQLRALLGQERFDVKVNGVLEIEENFPVIAGNSTELTQFCPTSCRGYRPHTLQYTDALAPPTRNEGCIVEAESPAYTWYHQFTINTTYNERFTRELLELSQFYAPKFKIKLEQDFNVQLVNTSGLRISIADYSKVGECLILEERITILAFYININQEVKTPNPTHHEAMITMDSNYWSYYYTNLNLKNGDIVFYSMRVILGHRRRMDYTVRGKIKFTYPNFIDSNRELSQYCPATALAPSPHAVFQDVVITTHPGSENHQFLTYRTSYHSQIINGTAKNLKYYIRFQLFNDTGFRMSIYGTDKNIQVVEFGIKLNEKFSSSDLGYQVSNITNKRINRWRYYYPSLKVNKGDKIHYWVRVIFGRWFTLVRGILEIREDVNKCAVGGAGPKLKPHLRIRGFNSRPSSLTVPNIAGALRGGTVERAFSWNHEFTINATFKERFTDETAKKWLEDAKLLKSMMEKDLHFHFTSPKGLRTSLTGVYFDKDSFRVELNGNEISSTDVQKEHNEYIYIYSLYMSFKPGDRVSYSVDVYFSKHIVRGNLHITSPQ